MKKSCEENVAEDFWMKYMVSWTVNEKMYVHMYIILYIQ